MRIWVFVGCAFAPVVAAQADLIGVDFQVNPAVGAPLASGTFTFDASLEGATLGFDDVEAFDITVRGVDYDLDFVNSGGFITHHFQFNTATDQFVPTVGLFASVVAAVKSAGNAGFQVSAGLTPTVSEYSQPGQSIGLPYSSISIQQYPVPEPVSALLLIGGLAGLATSRRRA